MDHPTLTGSEAEDRIRELEQGIQQAVPFLRMAEMGDQMDCLVCHMGNQDEFPEHRDGCELAELQKSLKNLIAGKA